MPDLFLEISPLQELSYTGIPKVTAELARWALDQENISFFWDDYLVPAEVVSEMLDIQSGVLFHALCSREIKLPPLLPQLSRSEHSVGIFPNKMTRFGFDRQVQIIHDLVYIVAPHYHHGDTIDYHGRSILSETTRTDLIICVSEATAEAVRHYLQPTKAKVMAIPLGSDAVIPAFAEAIPSSVENFILVLGTVEPRKNVELVLLYLSRNSHVFKEFAFVFCGRDGWLISFDSLIEKYGLSYAVASGRIIRRSFISAALKWDLLKAASFLLFPSMYEGFGLPVAEALSVGTPVLASNSSSIPEVGGSLVEYFDPTDFFSFERLLADWIRGRYVRPVGWSAMASERMQRRGWKDFASDVFLECRNA